MREKIKRINTRLTVGEARASVDNPIPRKAKGISSIPVGKIAPLKIPPNDKKKRKTQG